MIKEPKNKNYCASVVEIKTLVPLPNCDNVVHAVIMGNLVVVGKDVKVGDVGLFFPVETQLSDAYLKANNLYRKGEMNADPTQKGYFEENGRIRCVKFRQNKSEGLFMPISSINVLGKGVDLDIDLKPGMEFDEIEGIEICKKYVVKVSQKSSDHVKHKNGKGFKKYETKLIDSQFNFHQDTSMLYKNLHKINPESLISITYKLHGTSGISSKILCLKPLKWYEKVLKKLGVNIIETEYDYIYSSRKVIKNEELNPNAQHFYNVDIWGLAHKKLEEYLLDGMTLYYEIVGYLPSGAGIQGQYDYGCEEKTFEIYIYRITFTNLFGKVFEFGAKQVQDWCKQNGLKAVPQLYYGYAKDFYDGNITEGAISSVRPEEWRNTFLDFLKHTYNEKDCYMCKNKVPEEGCVIRIEGLNIEAYKQKSNRFYELETKLLDKGVSDIESEN